MARLSLRRDPLPPVRLPPGLLNSLPVRVLVAVLAGAAGGAAVELLSARWMAAGLVALAAGAAVLRWWPVSGILVLLGAAALDRFSLPVGGGNVKPEHVAAL